MENQLGLLKNVGKGHCRFMKKIELFCIQISSVKKLKCGDKNNKFLHQTTKMRWWFNKILRLKNKDGE